MSQKEFEQPLVSELDAALGVLDFRCGECGTKVFPGAQLCLDCKYGPFPVEGESK